jgi:predicted phage baseplate assembly protein
VPGSGGERLRLRLDAGGREAGNLGQNLVWEDVDALGYSARNPVAATGGAEAETVLDARDRVAAALIETQRAVTRADHETLALTTPGVGVARAHAAVGHHPLFPCAKVPGAVTLFVVPQVPRWEAQAVDSAVTWVKAPQPDPGMLMAVRRRLQAARLVGSEVFVRGVAYRRVNVRLELNADPIDPTPLRTRLQDVLLRYLDPLLGGDDGDGWPFGHPLRPSSLLRRVQETLGDEGSAERVWIGLDDQPPGEACDDVAIGAHSLVYLGQMQLQLLRTSAPAGGLQ